MVTKRQFKETFICNDQRNWRTNKGSGKQKEENMNAVITKKENLGELSKEYWEELKQYEETLEENEENKKILENFENDIFDFNNLLTSLKGIIKGHQWEAQEHEKERKQEA